MQGRVCRPEQCAGLRCSLQGGHQHRHPWHVRLSDQLVISNVTMDATTGKSSATLLISSDPEKGFTQIADSESLFNYPAYRYADSIYGGSIWDMVEYNNSLYVSICTGTLDNMPNKNTMQSFALVRGDRNADGHLYLDPCGW